MRRRGSNIWFHNLPSLLYDDALSLRQFHVIGVGPGRVGSRKYTHRTHNSSRKALIEAQQCEKKEYEIHEHAEETCP